MSLIDDGLKTFGQTAQGLSRGPLGIIALFIVLVYGFASLVAAFGSSFQPTERVPLIYFLVLFPVLVLGVFTWLVAKHHDKLYGPRDFRNEENYVKMQMAAAASLSLATAQRPTGDEVASEVRLDEVVDAVRHAMPRTPAAGDSWHQRVLWVDDRPDSNVYERRAFESIGLSFTLALTTQEALERLNKNKFGAIISDMGRQEGPREGYALLDAIRQKGDLTPFFIYAGSNLPEHKHEAAKRGAQGSTNDPQELFQLVTTAVIHQATR